MLNAQWLLYGTCLQVTSFSMDLRDVPWFSEELLSVSTFEHRYSLHLQILKLLINGLLRYVGIKALS